VKTDDICYVNNPVLGYKLQGLFNGIQSVCLQGSMNRWWINKAVFCERHQHFLN